MRIVFDTTFFAVLVGIFRFQFVFFCKNVSQYLSGNQIVFHIFYTFAGDVLNDASP